MKLYQIRLEFLSKVSSLLGIAYDEGQISVEPENEELHFRKFKEFRIGLIFVVFHFEFIGEKVEGGI